MKISALLLCKYPALIRCGVKLKKYLNVNVKELIECLVNIDKKIPRTSFMEGTKQIFLTFNIHIDHITLINMEEFGYCTYLIEYKDRDGTHDIKVASHRAVNDVMMLFMELCNTNETMITKIQCQDR